MSSKENRCRATSCCVQTVQAVQPLRSVQAVRARILARDRHSYLRWVFEAKKRFGLSVLNYIVTSNHIQLLVKDTSPNVIADSMQLIAGRSGQEYNQRKRRHGAFWEDRYHATAIDADEHLHRCLVYIDLNMVRAGVVNHPIRWKHGGYREIQDPPERYALIDLQELTASCGFEEVGDFQKAHRQWVEHALEHGRALRDERWSEAIAVGSLAFVEKVKGDLGVKVLHREFEQFGAAYALREPSEPYVSDSGIENDALRLENTLFWNEKVETT